jgi:hypothetical protein
LADTATVTGRGTRKVDGFSERWGLPLATSGDFSWPPAGTSTGHHRGLSHGHGHEDGVAPERARDQAIAHAAAVAGLTGVWLYQGLVPKLWRVDDGEVAIWRTLGLADSRSRRAVRVVGAAEVAIGRATVAGRRHRAVFLATAVAMPVLAIGAGAADRGSLTRAFNPVSLNWAAAALAVVAAATGDGLPRDVHPCAPHPIANPTWGTCRDLDLPGRARCRVRSAPPQAAVALRLLHGTSG